MLQLLAIILINEIKCVSCYWVGFIIYSQFFKYFQRVFDGLPKLPKIDNIPVIMANTATENEADSGR